MLSKEMHHKKQMSIYICKADEPLLMIPPCPCKWRDWVIVTLFNLP